MLPQDESMLTVTEKKKKGNAQYIHEEIGNNFWTKILGKFKDCNGKEKAIFLYFFPV